MDRVKLGIAIVLAIISLLLCLFGEIDIIKRTIILSSLVSSSISFAITSIKGDIEEKQVYELIIGLISLFVLLLIPIFVLWFSTVDFAA